MSITRAITHEAALSEARHQLAAGDAAGAQRHVAGVLRDDPADIAARLLQAEALLSLRDPSEALHALEALHWYTASAVDAESINDAEELASWRLLAEAMIQLDRKSDAVAVLSGVLERDPHDQDTLHRLAVLQVGLREHDQAAARLSTLLQINPNHTDAMALLADVHEATGQFNDALAMHMRLGDAVGDVSRASDDAALATTGRQRELGRQLHIARLLRKAGRIAEARAMLSDMVNECDDPDVAREAAGLAIEVGDDAMVGRSLSGLVDGETQDPEALAMQAEQDMRCGRFDASARRWWRLWRQDTGNVQAMVGLIVNAVVIRRHRFAERIFARFARRGTLRERRSMMARMWQRVMPGRLMHRLSSDEPTTSATNVLGGLLQETTQALERAAGEHPDHADVHCQLGVCYAAQGEGEAAAVCLETALSINAGYVAAGRAHVRHLIDAGDLEAASARLDSLLTARPDASAALFDLRLAVQVLRGAWAEAEALLDGGAVGESELRNAAASAADELARHRDRAGQQHWASICRVRSIGQRRAWSRAA